MKKTLHRHYSLGYFNTARGLAALFVILGHSMALFMSRMPAPAAMPVFGGAGRVIGGGVMAMLFMISGFYFQPRSMKRCIRTQTRMLIKPYVMTALAVFVCRGLLHLVNGWSFRATGAKLLATYLLGFNAPNGAVFLGLNVGTVSIFWFILALYWGWILFNWIRFLPNTRFKVVAVVGCVLIGWDLSMISPVWPMALPMAFLATGYIAVGYEIRKHRLMDEKLPIWLWAVILIITLICLAFGNVDIAACVWKLGLLDVAGSFCVGYLLLLLYAKLMDSSAGMLIFKRTDNIGIHAMQILCLHAFEKEVIPWRDLANLFPDRPVLCMALCFFGRALVIQTLVYVLAHTRRFIRRKKRVTLEITEE